MPLKLERALKREVDIGGVPHTVTVSPLGVRLVRKGFRKGVAVSWRRLLALAAGDLPVGDLPVGDLPVGDLPVGDLPVAEARAAAAADTPARDAGPG